MFNPFEQQNNEFSIDVSDEGTPLPVEEQGGAVDSYEAPMTEEEKELLAKRQQRLRESKQASNRKNILKRKELQQKRIQGARFTRAYLQENNMWVNAPQEVREFLDGFILEATLPPIKSNMSFIKKLFGEHVEIGTEVTLEGAFARTYKDKATIDRYVKDWAKKGIVVQFVMDVDNPLKSKYVIQALPID